MSKEQKPTIINACQHGKNLPPREKAYDLVGHLINKHYFCAQRLYSFTWGKNSWAERRFEETYQLQCIIAADILDPR